MQKKTGALAYQMPDYGEVRYTLHACVPHSVKSSFTNESLFEKLSRNLDIVQKRPPPPLPCWDNVIDQVASFPIKFQFESLPHRFLMVIKGLEMI